MKKVISALTVAAMCASMSASVLPAFAIDAANAEFYLKAVDAGKGTISADGATVTFASAADAKGAKITIQEFIKADTKEPYIQQILTGFRVKDSKSIKLGDSGVDYKKAGWSKESKTYTLNGVDVETNKFVNCFALVDDFDEFDPNVVQFNWGHSSLWKWEYDGPDTLNLVWAQPNGAKFNNDKTDTYPFTEFYATVGDDIKDGTYEIEIFDTWDNQLQADASNPKGTSVGTLISDGKNVTEVASSKRKGLTIVVGNGAATTPTNPTPTTPAPTTPAPTTPAPTNPAPTTPAPTQPAPSTPSQSLDDKKNSKEWTWYFDDVTYDPAKDKNGAAITAYVTKDGGTYGYEFTPLINGKSLKEAGFTIKRAKQTDEGYNFGSFDSNKENGHLGGASSDPAGDAKLADGTAVVTLNLVPPADAKPGTVYEVSFKGLSAGNFAGKKSTPKSIAGSITVAGGSTTTPTDPTPTTPAPTNPTPTTPAPTDPTPTNPTPSAGDKKDAKEWTWYFDDVNYDPATDKNGAAITAYVTKDGGTYGYEFTPLINGKSLKEAGFTIKRAKQTDDGYNFGSFDFNKDNGHLGGASSDPAGDAKMADGTAIVTLNLVPPADAKEGTKYIVSFKGLSVGNFAGVKSTPKTIDGSITIGKGGTTPTEPAPTTPAPTTPAPTETTPSTPGSYIYGDVNEDGKVELIDVVKLNRFLTGIDKELTAKATVQANCYRAAGESDADTTSKNLDGSDSVEILKSLLGLVEKLPTLAK